VASGVHAWAELPKPEDPHPVQTVLTETPELSSQMMKQYFNSKLLNVLFTIEYAKRCPFEIEICSANPGYTDSELGMKDPKSGNVIRPRPDMGKVPRTTYEGAKTIIHATIAPDVRRGAYYTDMKDIPTRDSTLGEVGERFATNVWKDTLEILKRFKENGPFESWVEN